MAGTEKPRRTAYADKSQPHLREWTKHPTGRCSYPGCNAKHFTHDLCNKHWLRHRRKEEIDSGMADPAPTPHKSEWKQDPNQWLPQWKRKPVKSSRVRRHANEIARTSSKMWETTAQNRSAGIILRRRAALAALVDELNAQAFVIEHAGPEVTRVKGETNKASIATSMLETLVKIKWISVFEGAYNLSELGKAIIVEGLPNDEPAE